MQGFLLLCLVALRARRASIVRYHSSHIVRQHTGLGWPIALPANGIDPQKSRDNTRKKFNSSTSLSSLWERNTTSNAIRVRLLMDSFYNKQWFSAGGRGALIKDVLWSCQCLNNGVTGSYMHALCIHCFPFRFDLALCTSACNPYLLSIGDERSVKKPLCTQSESVYLGYFRRSHPCHCSAKCSTNFSPLMPSICLWNWPQMRGVCMTGIRVLSCTNAWQGPASEVIIYLICSPNKLLTLLLVSQHVSSWFVIESQ